MNIDGEFYLCDSVGRQVLNADGEPVLLSRLIMVRMKVKRLMWPGLSVFLKIPIQDGLDVLSYNVYGVSDKNGKYIHRRPE